MKTFLSWLESKTNICEKCRENPKIKGERFCKVCKAVMLDDMKKSGYLNMRDTGRSLKDNTPIDKLLSDIPAPDETGWSWSKKNDYENWFDPNREIWFDPRKNRRRY